MDNKNIEKMEFTVLKKHENPIHSSALGNLTEVLQLCQNDLTKEHFYTYEILDFEGGIVGGRLFYQFKKPNQAVDEWSNFTSADGLKSNVEVDITKQNFPPGKRSKFN